jgi:hypothetical protein
MPPPTTHKIKKINGGEKQKTGDSAMGNTTVKNMDVEGNVVVPFVRERAVILERQIKCCEHQQYDGSGYNVMDEKEYFTMKYLSTRPTAPKECAKCKISFIVEENNL